MDVKKLVSLIICGTCSDPAKAIRRDIYRILKNKRERRIADVRQEMRRDVPPLLSSDSVLRVIRRCQDCGLSDHMHGYRDKCPVLAIHLRDNVFDTGVRTAFFCFWPCNYCRATTHALPMCDLLHSFCRECYTRGHHRASECRG